MASVGALVAMIAVVLPAGVVAATALDGEPATGPSRVDAASLGASALGEQRAQTTSVVVAPPAPSIPPTTVARPAPATSTTRSVPGPTSTTVRSRPSVPGSTTTSTLVTVLKPPPAVSTTGRWSNGNDGVSVRMRMEPTSPVAGVPVTFYVDDLIAGDPCCFVKVMFGDMTDVDLAEPTCDSPTSRSGMVATHTYAVPGVYRVSLFTATLPCQTPPGGKARGVVIEACIVVGPNTSGSAWCRPLSGEIGH